MPRSGTSSPATSRASPATRLPPPDHHHSRSSLDSTARMLSRAQRSQTRTSPRRGSISTIQVSGGLSSTAPHIEQLTDGGVPAGFTPAGFTPAGFTPAGFTPAGFTTAGYRVAPPPAANAVRPRPAAGDAGRGLTDGRAADKCGAGP